MTTPSRRELLIALNTATEISRPAVYRLSRELDRWFNAAGAPGLLAAELGVPEAQCAKALALRERARELAARETAEAETLNGHILTLDDPGYPPGLLQLSPPPPVITVRGELPDGPAVAIVGSRRADAYGREAAELFARSLAAAGVTIVSGFARGIDAAAHRGALGAPGGRTVAVLGCGLAVDYPRGHARLGDEIAAQGALVTEFPCGTTPRAWHFPVRNRIIAALSAGTLVVEATARSGSLVTARHALDLGREVWAVPGRLIDPRAAGPNALIRDGAALVQEPRDILESLGFRSIVPAAPSRGGEGRGGREAVPAVARERPPGLAGTILGELAEAGGEGMAPEEIAAAAAAPV